MSRSHFESAEPPLVSRSTAIVSWLNAWRDSIGRFFLEPRTAETLSVLRLATGAMIAYIHAIWLSDLSSFFGPDALLDLEVIRSIHSRVNKWTYLASTDSLTIAWLHEVAAMLAGIAMALGFATRLTVPLAWFTTLMTAHRLAPFLFGLDQITLSLAMYLMLGRSGTFWSIDSWIRKRWSQSGKDIPAWARWLGWGEQPGPCWTNTVATRLIQMHLCVIYLFGGLGKLRGWMWWDGTAMWFASTSYEYQSLDLTWIGLYPWLGSIATHATLLWELFYVALIWPRLTRPLVLMMAVCVHGGIALYMGMITFGWMMIIANLIFVEPSWWGRSGGRSPSCWRG